jgi:hypothetical protein
MTSCWVTLARLVNDLVSHVVGPVGSSLTPRATIRSAPSGSGRCSLRASSGDEVIQVSTSSGVVRITGIALGWIAPTSAFGSVVRNAKMSFVVSPSLTFRTDVQLAHMPAKASRGRLSSGANQTGTFLPSIVSYSENDVMAPDAARFAQCLGGHSQACGGRSGSRKERK